MSSWKVCLVILSLFLLIDFMLVSLLIFLYALCSFRAWTIMAPHNFLSSVDLINIYLIHVLSSIYTISLDSLLVDSLCWSLPLSHRDYTILQTLLGISENKYFPCRSTSILFACLFLKMSSFLAYSVHGIISVLL